ncbi:MAG: hypothetical protein ACOH10_10440 [Rhodoglobus sp.]
MKRVVLLIGGAPSSSSGATLSGESSYLRTLLKEKNSGIHLSVVSFGFTRDAEGLDRNIELDSRRKPVLDRLLNAIGVRALHRRLSTFPIGRLINSVGPLDQGRVFWRYVRGNADALAALKGADTVVSADLPGVKTAWIAQRRGWTSRAEYDSRASGYGVAFGARTANGEHPAAN